MKNIRGWTLRSSAIMVSTYTKWGITNQGGHSITMEARPCIWAKYSLNLKLFEVISQNTN